MYKASENRYDNMKYLRCGKSGLLLPRIALGLWHNFGSCDCFDNMKEMLFEAFDQGITHFDLANNYGPIPGSAEENLGRIMDSDLRPYRDELIISTKAGFDMWPGPYGDLGSRKYLMASIDQSLKRMKLDYVDIFYHHHADPDTPLEETMGALSDIVKQGKALYVGLSNYDAEQLREAAKILKDNGTPLLIVQPFYNMLERWAEESGLLDAAAEVGAGVICYSPLAQGVLTDRYLDGIPKDSRAARNYFLQKDSITEQKVETVRKLQEVAFGRGQSLAEMALCWNLRKDRVTTVLMGASRKEQISNNVKIINHLEFSEEELLAIEDILKEYHQVIN